MRQKATTVSGSVRVCVALTSGAIFGMAAQTTLHHYGLDLGSVHHDLVVWVARGRSALAWWAWWTVMVTAFFVGPFSIAVARFLADNWWLFRGPRLLVSAMMVLALAVVGHLNAAALPLGVSAGAALGGLVVTSAALLAALGALTLCATEVGAQPPRLPALARGRARTVNLVAAPLPRPGGGSVDSGFPLRRLRRGHALARGWHRPRLPARFGRWAIAAALVVVAFTAASAVSGGAVLLELFGPAAIRQLVAGAPPPEIVATGSIERAGPVALAMHPMAMIAAAAPHITAPMSEDDLTFAKGYARRHAVLEAAGLLVASAKTEIKLPAKLSKRRYAAALRLAATAYVHHRDARRTRDRTTEERFANNRRDGYRYDEVADHDRRADRHRRSARNRHRDRNHGYDRFARYEPRGGSGF